MDKGQGGREEKDSCWIKVKEGERRKTVVDKGQRGREEKDSCG